MKCPKCGSENPPENQYCGICSRTLSARKPWSLHDQAWWNLSEAEKMQRLKRVILPLLLATALLIALLILKFTGYL